MNKAMIFQLKKVLFRELKNIETSLEKNDVSYILESFDTVQIQKMLNKISSDNNLKN